MTTEAREPESFAALDAAGRAAAADVARRAAQLDAWLALTGRGPVPGALVRLPMLSGSMAPALPCGCELVIDPLGAPRAKVGDVVVLALDDRLVAHRVLGWRTRGEKRWLLEHGDANGRGEWQPIDRVVGLVVGATQPDGSDLPCPRSRRRALRGLWRHLRARPTTTSPAKPSTFDPGI
jgi:hypothetical protein